MPVHVDIDMTAVAKAKRLKRRATPEWSSETGRLIKGWIDDFETDMPRSQCRDNVHCLIEGPCSPVVRPFYRCIPRYHLYPHTQRNEVRA